MLGTIQNICDYHVSRYEHFLIVQASTICLVCWKKEFQSQNNQIHFLQIYFSALVWRQVNVYFVSRPDRNTDNQYFTTLLCLSCKKVVAFVSDIFGQIKFVLFLNDHHVFPKWLKIVNDWIVFNERNCYKKINRSTAIKFIWNSDLKQNPYQPAGHGIHTVYYLKQ